MRRACCSLLLATAAAAAAPQHNVLHFIVDDLRPELGAYGLPDRHTPNIDRLAANGTVFDRAYCQQAVCGPSRNSFLTGRRPDRSRTWNFINHFREDHPEWTSLPGVFLNAGMLALGSGKTFHPKMPPAYDGAKSWSAAALPYRNPCWNTADFPTESCSKSSPASATCDGGLPCIPCPVDIRAQLLHDVNVSVANEWCEIEAYEDVITVDWALTLLRRHHAHPFFLAVGLHKPHMPWQFAPEDLAKHPLSSVQLPKHPTPPDGMPPIAYHFSESTEHASPWEPLADASVLAARRAYRAAVTFMDRQVGRVLDELDQLGIAGTTAVVLHGDHGWQLGEHGEWRKMTNFELAARVPLIVRAPWLGAAAPRRSDDLVELVDLLPTLAELAGVPLPGGEDFDGRSFAGVLSGAAAGKTAAFTQYPRRVEDASRPWKGNSIIHKDRRQFTHMGYSVRTAEWRYTEWIAWNGTTLSPEWGTVAARELYDHRGEPAYPTDFDAGENANVAADPANAGAVAALSATLRAQFAG